VPAVRKAVVMLDAGFEAVLATVLLFGVLFGSIDETDFPGPASDLLLALFALALYAFAVFLATLVKNEAVTRTALGLLAAGNAAFAVLLAAWALAASGFSSGGRAVVWASVVVLLALATSQAVARERR
jgi:hypothetical protein